MTFTCYRHGLFREIEYGNEKCIATLHNLPNGGGCGRTGTRQVMARRRATAAAVVVIAGRTAGRLVRGRSVALTTARVGRSVYDGRHRERTIAGHRRRRDAGVAAIQR